MKKPKTKKRQKLGQGFIWFGGKDLGGVEGYTEVCLTRERDGRGGRSTIKTGKLGGWQKVNLYAEWIS